MSSDTPEKWKEKVDLTWEEYFDPPAATPHKGIVAIARELENEIGKEKAHEILSRVANNLQTRRIKTPKGSPDEIFEEWVKLNTPSNSYMQHAINPEVLETTNRRHSIRISDCLWVKTFREMGAEDIGYLWTCKTDYATVKAFHPNIVLIREKTLMQGNDCCEFTWYWKEDE
jgi:hypothetical protein